MKNRRILAFLMAFVMTLGTTAFAAETTFSDVPEDAYYAEAVAWAVEKGITAGKGNGIFDPDAAVTRAEAVTFLWRMAGQPEPTQSETFADVESASNNSWYKTAVAWAVEKGITNGTGKGNFSPSATCSRGMILTMLYRMSGCPLDEASKAEVPEDTESWTIEDFSNAMIQMLIESLRSEDGFADVKEGAYYEFPVLWAALNGILDENQIDTDAMAVHPEIACPRGEMVYYLYHASGDAPAPAVKGSVEVGTVPETVVLDKNGVKITVTGIENDSYGDPRLTLSAVNGSEKTLRVEAGDFFVNTFALYPQVYIPVEDEDGWVFYADAVVAPGETKDFYVSLSSVKDMGITAICELEMTLSLSEVKEDEDGYYEYEDDFADSDIVRIKTSLYSDGVSYDMEGTTVYDKDGLKVLVVRAENDEYQGPQIMLYVYNGGSGNACLDLTELKLDGETYEAFCSMNVPAGKRYAATAYIYYDYENTPVAAEAELTLVLLDEETGEAAVTFEPVKITMH